MSEFPELPDLSGPVTPAALRQHADAICARAHILPAGEARAWREDAEHIRDAANRLEAIERGEAHA